MVTLTFQCATLSQLREEMAAFLNGSLPQINHTPLPPPLPIRPEETAKVAPKLEAADATPAQEKKRRGRKPKALEQQPVYDSPASPEESFEVKKHHQEPADETDDTPTTAQDAGAQDHNAPIVNKEAVHQALQQVNVAVNLQKAREILQKFGVNRISEIKEDQYRAFIETCNEAVMLEG